MNGFNDYQQRNRIYSWNNNQNGQYSGSEKLVPHNQDETYVIHYRDRKLAHDLGVRTIKIHRAISFMQSHWLKPYIDVNTGKERKNCLNIV